VLIWGLLIPTLTRSTINSLVLSPSIVDAFFIFAFLWSKSNFGFWWILAQFGNLEPSSLIMILPLSVVNFSSPTPIKCFSFHICTVNLNVIVIISFEVSISYKVKFVPLDFNFCILVILLAILYRSSIIASTYHVSNFAFSSALEMNHICATHLPFRQHYSKPCIFRALSSNSHSFRVVRVRVHRAIKACRKLSFSKSAK